MVIKKRVKDKIALLTINREEALNAMNPIILKELKDIQVEMINRFGLFPKELKSLFFETEIALMAVQQKIKEIKIGEQNIKFSYLNAGKDKTLKKGVDFEDSVKKIYKKLNLIKKVS